MFQVVLHAADLGYESLDPGDDADHEHPQNSRSADYRLESGLSPQIRCAAVLCSGERLMVCKIRPCGGTDGNPRPNLALVRCGSVGLPPTCLCPDDEG
jgi:hypothetical protein